MQNSRPFQDSQECTQGIFVLARNNFTILKYFTVYDHCYNAAKCRSYKNVHPHIINSLKCKSAKILIVFPISYPGQGWESLQRYYNVCISQKFKKVGCCLINIQTLLRDSFYSLRKLCLALLYAPFA